jgi:hypothetical protein
MVMLCASKVFSQVDLDLETGAVFGGYSDVRIPGDGGTLFSLSEELDANPGVFYRLRVFCRFNDRHHLGALYAPLAITATGQLDRNLLFAGETFPAHTALEATYKFNSYRLMYRYDFIRKTKLTAGAGITAKIRDAKIAVKGNGRASEKTNVGFVPIIHFRLLWGFYQQFSFLLDGDALAAPQGRAEDVIAAFLFKASDKVSLKAGYRIVEGGSDVNEVYSFTLLNYAVIGAIIHF